MSKWFLVYRRFYHRGINHRQVIDAVLKDCPEMALAAALDRNLERPEYSAIEGVKYWLEVEEMKTWAQEAYARSVNKERNEQIDIDLMPVDEFCQWMSSPAYSGGVQ